MFLLAEGAWLHSPSDTRPTLQNTPPPPTQTLEPCLGPPAALARALRPPWQQRRARRPSRQPSAPRPQRAPPPGRPRGEFALHVSSLLCSAQLLLPAVPSDPVLFRRPFHHAGPRPLAPPPPPPTTSAWSRRRLAPAPTPTSASRPAPEACTWASQPNTAPTVHPENGGQAPHAHPCCLMQPRPLSAPLAVS